MQNNFVPKEGLQTLRGHTYIKTTVSYLETKNPAFRQENRVLTVSERQDLNLRPLQPHCSALPDCATLR